MIIIIIMIMIMIIMLLLLIIIIIESSIYFPPKPKIQSKVKNVKKYLHSSAIQNALHSNSNILILKAT